MVMLITNKPFHAATSFHSASSLKVIRFGLFVVHLPLVSERLNCTRRACHVARYVQHLAPRIVGIFYNHITVCVIDPVDVESQSRRLRNNLRKTIDSTFLCPGNCGKNNEISIILIVDTTSYVLPHIYKFPTKQPCYLYIQLSVYIP